MNAGRGIGPNGARAIAEALTSNQTVTFVDLSCAAPCRYVIMIQVSLDSCRGRSYVYHSQLVLSCPLLLHSAVNDIEDEGARALAQTLLVNTSVNTVNLAGTFVPFCAECCAEIFFHVILCLHHHHHHHHHANDMECARQPIG